MKECNNCLKTKSLGEFYTVNKRGKPTIYHICKSCCSTQKTSMKEYYRNWELQKNYGITLETYKSESLKRNNQCDICGDAVKSLHVDHCHTTGRVRGYLCGPCNRRIGLLKDSKKILERAVAYFNE